MNDLTDQEWVKIKLHIDLEKMRLQLWAQVYAAEYARWAAPGETQGVDMTCRSQARDSADRACDDFDEKVKKRGL